MEKIMLINIIHEILVTKLHCFVLGIHDREKFYLSQLFNASFHDTA